MHCTRVATMRVCVRTAFVKKLPTGISELTRDVLCDVFVKGGGRVELDLGLQAACVIKLKFGGFVADEEALNAAFFIKGASGTIPCATLCCVTNKQRPEDVANGVPSLQSLDDKLVDISCPSLARCQPRSCADVWWVCDSLQASPKGELADLEHRTGIKYHPSSMLFCQALRPILRPPEHTVVDPMHILFLLVCWRVKS